MTVAVDVPGGSALRLEHAVLDVNGTLAVEGDLAPGVEKRLAALRKQLTVHLLSGDTHGRTGALAKRLRLEFTRVGQPDEAGAKRAFVHELGGHAVAAIGNGANDAGMLEEAALGIVVVAAEGAAAAAIRAADVVVASPMDALDLLLRPTRLVATLRR